MTNAKVTIASAISISRACASKKGMVVKSIIKTGEVIRNEVEEKNNPLMIMDCILARQSTQNIDQAARQ
jgi:hypothetical protein